MENPHVTGPRRLRIERLARSLVDDGIDVADAHDVARYVINGDGDAREIQARLYRTLRDAPGWPFAVLALTEAGIDVDERRVTEVPSLDALLAAYTDSLVPSMRSGTLDDGPCVLAYALRESVRTLQYTGNLRDADIAFAEWLELSLDTLSDLLGTPAACDAHYVP